MQARILKLVCCIGLPMCVRFHTELIVMDHWRATGSESKIRQMKNVVNKNGGQLKKTDHAKMDGE
jgi:hypothetical protein